jgi:hypothetical protein
LHEQIVSQCVVVVEVFVAATQTVDALREQITQAVGDSTRVAWVTEYRSSPATQANAFIDLSG